MTQKVKYTHGRTGEGALHCGSGWTEGGKAILNKLYNCVEEDRRVHGAVFEEMVANKRLMEQQNSSNRLSTGASQKPPHIRLKNGLGAVSDNLMQSTG